MTANSSGRPGAISSTMAPMAPSRAASATKLCASNFSPRSATKRSPAFSERESVQMLVTFARSPPARRAPPAHWATSWRGVGSIGGFGRGLVFERAASDRHVVEVDRAVGEFLIGFVAFPGDEDDVPHLREIDRTLNGGRAILDHFVVPARQA